MKRVYDDRSPEETLFQGEGFECIAFINENFDESDDDFSHVWIEDAK